MARVRKIAVMGFRAVGKSALSRQFVEKKFTDDYNPTIENTFTTDIKFHKHDYQLFICDTAGQDECSLFGAQYGMNYHGYVLVYSVLSKSSLEIVRVINDKILNFRGTSDVPRVLVGSKLDMAQEKPMNREVETEDGHRIAKEWGCGFVECSSKNNSGVDEAFFTLLEQIEAAEGERKEESDVCSMSGDNK